MTINVLAEAGPPITVPYIGLLLTDPRVGVVMNSSADQGAKLQLALDMAGAGQTDSCVIVPPGYVKCRQQLEWPTTRCIRLIGMGGGDRHLSSPSAIYWDTDLGPDTYAIDLNLTSYPWQIEDITLEGPGITPTPGQLPCNMNGVKCNTRGIMERVRIGSFRAGVYVQNDHQEWRSCNFQDNGIAMDFGENGGGGLGDLVIDRCYLTGSSRASIGISSTNTLANAIFTQGHAGAAPFGVWRYPSAGTACSYSGSGSTLTAVAMDWTLPTDGLTIEGTNIPPGTTILSHSGSLGNYTFVLSNAPTGAVSRVVIGRRGTAMVGCTFNNWSWEGCNHAVIYDDCGAQTGSWGSFTNLTFTTTDSSTFASSAWQQQNVAATGSGASTTISGVAVTNFTPTKGMMVTGTNVGTGAKIVSATGSSGNWTLVVDVANSGTVTTVTVKQPTDLANYEVGGVLGWYFTNGTPPPINGGHVGIRANSIKHVHFDSAEELKNNLFDFPTTIRPLAIRAAYSSSGQECEDITFGGQADTGGLRMAALVTDDTLAQGELVEPANLAHVRKSLATGVPLGHIVGSWSQGEVAVFVTSTPSHAFSRAKNTSGVTINNGDLLKPHSGGGIQKATSITDVPIVGQAKETITAGSLGQVWSKYL